MKLVVKIGGRVLEEARLQRRLVRQVVRLAQAGHKVVVVHGGGATLTDMLAKLGLKSRFVSGLRYTDTRTRDAALMVLAGLVNKRLVAEFSRQGQDAVGLCGGDAALARVKKLELGPNVNSNGRKVGLGWVGRTSRVNTAFLSKLLKDGMVPVIASLGLGPKGEYYNVNADEMASAIAVALEADSLIFVSDTEGVKDSSRRRIPLIKVHEIESLVRRKIVTDGMVPKLRSCARTLKKNVSEIAILGAGKRDALWNAVVGKKNIGTRIVRSP